MKRSTTAYAVLLAAISMQIVGFNACSYSSSAVKIDTEYTSVFLDNGQIFVGRAAQRRTAEGKTTATREMAAEPGF